MGNAYELITKNNSSATLHEMSCLFTLDMDDGMGEGFAIPNLTPDQIGEIAVKMIHAASYFVQDSQAFMDKYADLARKY